MESTTATFGNWTAQLVQHVDGLHFILSREGEVVRETIVPHGMLDDEPVLRAYIDNAIMDARLGR